MKKIILLFLVLSIFSGYHPAIAQDTLVVSSLTEEIVSCPSTDKIYNLPLVLKFDMTFKDHAISFFRDIQHTKRIGAKATFGGDNLGDIGKDRSTNNFFVKIKSDRIISFMNEEGIPTGDEFFFIQIDDKPVCGPFKISGPGNNDDDERQRSLEYNPGYLFYDALELNKLKNNTDSRSIAVIKKILSFYEIKNTDDLKANPFLATIFPDVFKRGGVQSTGGGVSSIISSVGGLDVTNIADGLAKFLVKRAKQELTMAFFDKLKKIIEEAEDLKTLFPQTSYLLAAMGNEVYNFEAYVQNLREAFKDDIKYIPDNFPGIIDNHKDPGEFFDNQHQELEAALRTACYVVNALQEQTHPGDILDNYPLEFLDSIPSKNYKGALQTLQLISAALKDSTNSDTASYWVNLKKVREMAGDKSSLKIYLGLIYQRAKMNTITFDSGFLLTKLLDGAANSFDKAYDAYKRYIQVFAAKLDALNKMIKSYDKPATDSLALEKYAKYFTATVDLIEYCTSVSDLPHFADSKIGNLHKQLKTYFNIAYATADLTMAIIRRNYSAAINKTVFIYDEIIAKGNEASKTTLVSLVKYGSFMASVATARNSDEVEEAIEAFALPAGSSKIKRRTFFNVSLNGYAGFFYGHESIPDIKDNRTFNNYGVTAPVGVCISAGRKRLFNPFANDGNASYSLFISLIDVGSIASYRVKNDSIAQIPTIELKDIFSPGAFLSIGIPKTPLSFNLGAQFGPNLRKVKDAQNDYSNKTYTRLSASLCVDIPIVNFYTKSQ